MFTCLLLQVAQTKEGGGQSAATSSFFCNCPYPSQDSDPQQDIFFKKTKPRRNSCIYTGLLFKGSCSDKSRGRDLLRGTLM